ncbi:MAG: mechanosensitive ion channel family protein [Myxococcales bacterium]|nr:mechanosensitive ion channel family protein [Myxococcales bacterium]
MRTRSARQEAPRGDGDARDARASELALAGEGRPRRCARSGSSPLGLVLALGLLAGLFWPQRGLAQEPIVDCTTPRRAVLTFLGNLPPNADRPSDAIRCFDWEGAGIPAGDRVDLAVRLKSVLDLEGWWVKVDEMPDIPEPEGIERVLLADPLEEVFFVRIDGEWKVAAEGIRAIPRIHAEHVNEAVEHFVEALPAGLRAKPFLDVAWWQLLAFLLTILASLAARLLVAAFVAKQGGRLIRSQGERADASIVAKAAAPIGTLAASGLAWYLLPMLRFSALFNSIGNVAIRVLAASAGVMLAYRLVDLTSDVFARRAESTDTKLDDQIIPLIRKTVKVFVVGLGIIFVLQNMDIDVGSLIAGASLGGLAFTLAARDTVANLFGSVSIFADQPFQVGDWVVIDGNEGVVIEVGMRSTRIRTFYDSVISVPNSKVANCSVDNYGLRKYRRCSITLGLTYDTSPDQMQAFCEGIRAILRANESVRQDNFEVHFRNFSASSLEVMLYFFFEAESWSEELRNRHNVFLEILRLARALGVSFAFPTQTLHIDSVAQPAPLSVRPELSREQLEAKVRAFGPGGELARPEGRQLTADGFAPSAIEALGSDAEG